MTLAILASLILWPVYLAVFLVLSAIGAVILAPLSLLGLYYWRPSMFPQFRGTSGEERRSVWSFGWLTWLWGNEEDGVTGPRWWRIRTDALVGGTLLARAWSTYRWSAHRNPVNNLRFIPGLNPRIQPDRIHYWSPGPGTPGHQLTLTWQGVHAGLIAFPVIRGRTFRFWLGWKLKPQDAGGVADEDMRKVRCGFAIQFKRVGP